MSSKFQSPILLGGQEGDNQGHPPSTPLAILPSAGTRAPSTCPFQGTLLHLTCRSLAVRTPGRRSGSLKKYRYSGPIQTDPYSAVCDGFLTFCFFPCVSNMGTTDSIHHLELLWEGQVGWGNEGRLKSLLWRLGETVVFLSARETPCMSVSSVLRPTLARVTQTLLPATGAKQTRPANQRAGALTTSGVELGSVTH